MTHQSNQGATSLEVLRSMMSFWPIFLALAALIATWVRMEGKVQAMEPISQQVQKLDETVDDIKLQQQEVIKKLEVKEAVDKVEREKINDKLDLILEQQNMPQPKPTTK